MKGEIVLRILEAIGETTTTAADLLHAFLRAGYGASYRKLEREFQRQQKTRRDKLQSGRSESQLRQDHYTLVYKLKRDGLIKEANRRNRKVFGLTFKGKSKLAFLQKQAKRVLPQKHYHRTAGLGLILVSFDIPEKERRKRDWLRAVLKNLGMTMVHKSVWVGKVKIPEELLEDLRALRITKFVEILEVGKTGSLRHLT